jgi:hypothetical protein
MLMKDLQSQQGIFLMNIIQNKNITLSYDPNRLSNNQSYLNTILWYTVNSQLPFSTIQNLYYPHLINYYSNLVNECNSLFNNINIHNLSNLSVKVNNSNEELFSKNKVCEFSSAENIQNPKNERNKKFKDLFADKTTKSFEIAINPNKDNFKDSLVNGNLNEDSSVANKHNMINAETKLENSNPLKKKKKREKRFECKYENCKKSFEYKWILSRHLDSHFCFRLFKCETCSKSYKSKENLNLHVKNKHLGLKPYNCDFCDSRFSHRNGIKT